MTFLCFDAQTQFLKKFDFGSHLCFLANFEAKHKNVCFKPGIEFVVSNCIMYILQLYHNTEFSRFCKTPSIFAANHYVTATPPPSHIPQSLRIKIRFLMISSAEENLMILTWEEKITFVVAFCRSGRILGHDKEGDETEG